MEAIKQLIRVPDNHEVTIKIPEDIPANELAELILIVWNGGSEFRKKVKLLEETKNDPLFMQDLAEMSGDFSDTDLEGWE